MTNRANSENARYGLSWIALAVLTLLAVWKFPGRDDLVFIALGNLAMSVLVVAAASRDIAKTLGQLCCGTVALMAVASIMIERSLNPISLIPLSFGAVAGCANAFAGARLSLLTLVGQIFSAGVITFVSVNRFALPASMGSVCLVAACAVCLLGSLIARTHARTSVGKGDTEQFQGLSQRPDL